MSPEKEKRNLPMGTLALGTTKNSLTLEGFSLTSCFGYWKRSEQKSPQWDTGSKKSDRGYNAHPPIHYPKWKKKCCLHFYFKVVVNRYIYSLKWQTSGYTQRLHKSSHINCTCLSVALFPLQPPKAHILHSISELKRQGAGTPCHTLHSTEKRVECNLRPEWMERTHTPPHSPIGKHAQQRMSINICVLEEGWSCSWGSMVPA